jgi:hypothetical protein
LRFESNVAAHEFLFGMQSILSVVAFLPAREIRTMYR